MFHLRPGVELVDQALAAARALLNGNENAALFVLAPIPATASNADRDQCLKKRRLLVDKVMQHLGFNSIQAF